MRGFRLELLQRHQVERDPVASQHSNLVWYARNILLRGTGPQPGLGDQNAVLSA